MPVVQPRVELLAHTPEPLSLVYAAFRQCYHAGFVADMWPRLLAGDIGREKQAQFVASIMESGHASPVEHVSFTFALGGVSRALTHQLVRHRIASYSQQSQRYVDGSDFDYLIPPEIRKNPEALARFEGIMREIGSAYRDLKGLLEEAGRTGSKANEDARFVLPQATASNIVVTMNCRALLNFFEHRCCRRAQWEIRHVADEMLALCRGVLPEVFGLAGAKCERLRYCPRRGKVLVRAFSCQSIERVVMDKLILAFCRLGFAGLSPIMPGTCGSALAAVLAPFLFIPLPFVARIVVLVLVFWIGGMAATRGEQILGYKDPGEIVIDELLGMWLVLLPFSNPGWAKIGIAFVLFRIFDMWKPWPVHASESWLPGGYGIMIDDVMAGLQALLVMWLLQLVGFWGV